jgi:membrane-associated phospholipid phosphatase
VTNGETPTSPPVRIQRLWPLVSAGIALALVGGLAAVIFYREHNKPFGFELEWMGELVEHRSGFWTTLALVFNAIGGGLLAAIVIPVLLIAGLLLWRRPWAALYVGIGSIASAVLVKVLKQLIGRPRPQDILVSPDFGSFPSGHSANAALLAAVLTIVFARTWIWVVGAVYTIGMMLSRTYLGAHWISDTVGGMLIGVGVAIVLWAPFAYRLYHEQRAPHPFRWPRRRPAGLA